MRGAFLLIVGIGSFCIPAAVAQQTQGAERKYVSVAIPGAARPVAINALHIARETGYPATIRLSGKVEIRTPICLATGQESKPVCDGYMVLHADDAILHEDTGEIEAHGDVRVTPILHERAAK